jgi:hypothetical protein
MSLEQASKFGTIDDVVNMLQLQGVLFYFVLPCLCALLSIYVIREIKRKTARKTTRKADRKSDRADKKKQTTTVKNIKHKVSKPFSSADVMMKQLDNLDEPIIKSGYSNLAINFDKQGRSIKE